MSVQITRTDDGNAKVEVTDGSNTLMMELNPDQAITFARRLLKAVYPRDHVFVLPVPQEDDGD